MMVTVGSRSLRTTSKMMAAAIFQCNDGMKWMKVLANKSRSIIRLVFIDLSTASISALDCLRLGLIKPWILALMPRLLQPGNIKRHLITLFPFP